MRCRGLVAAAGGCLPSWDRRIVRRTGEVGCCSVRPAELVIEDERLALFVLPDRKKVRGRGGVTMTKIIAVTTSLCGLAFFGLFAFLVVDDREGQLLALIAAVSCLLLSRLGDIVSFSVGADGMKSEFEKRIDQAEVKLDQLQELAIAWAKDSTSSNFSAGRWGGGSTRREKDEKLRSTLTTLEKLGVDQKERNAVSEIAFRWDYFDYSSYVMDAVSQEATAEWNRALNERAANASGPEIEASPDELEAFLKKHNRINDEVSERLEDYRHYKRMKSHRRPSVWYSE